LSLTHNIATDYLSHTSKKDKSIIPLKLLFLFKYPFVKEDFENKKKKEYKRKKKKEKKRKREGTCNLIISFNTSSRSIWILSDMLMVD